MPSVYALASHRHGIFYHLLLSLTDVFTRISCLTRPSFDTIQQRWPQCSSQKITLKF
jgi:hypothetical protein